MELTAKQMHRSINQAMIAQRLSLPSQFLDSMHSLEFTGSSYQLNAKYLFAYDAIGNNINYIYFDDQGSGLAPYEKTEYAFTSGKLSSETDFEWAQTAWVPYSRLDHSYNAQNLVSSTISSSHDGSQFVENDKTDFSYNTSNLLILEMYYYKNSAQWENYGKLDYIYNVSGKLTEKNWYYLDQTQWIPSRKTEYTYNAGGYEILNLEKWWNGTSWENDYRTETSYDNQNRISVIVNFWWNGTLWEEDYKEERTYDAAGNISTWIESDWDGSAWAPQFKYDLNYNNSFAFNDLKLPYFMDESSFLFNHLLTGLDLTIFTGSSWNQLGKYNLYWSSHSGSGITENQNIIPSVFPNPASGVLHFRPANDQIKYTYLLTDLKGSVLLSNTSNGSVTLYVGDFAAGMYFVKILEGNQLVSTQKVILK